MAVSPGGIPTELQEGITAFLGTKKVLLVLSIQLQVKSKYDDFILVLTPWRAYVLPVMLPVRVHSSFSFLEVREMTVQEPSVVVIETDAASYAFRFMSLDDLEQVVIHVTMSLKKVFPDSSLGTLLKNSPPSLYERIQQITDSLEEVLQSSPGPCGGFSETYAALCDYNGFAFREEIQWDVDNIYHSQDCREFNLLDFSHLESRDVALSVAALSFNLWFTKLSCKDFRLNQEISEQLLYMLSKSVTLEELVLENSGLKADFVQRMAQALSSHPNSVLHTINLSGNQLEDRGVSAFSRHVEKSSKGLQSLSLARTMLTAKGMSTLCKALTDNKAIGFSLRHLDLSGNPGALAGDDISNLQSLLQHCHSLSHLSLAGTDCPLDALFGALVHGSHTSLIHLDLSKNVYSHKRVKTISPDIKEFFSQACSLSHVSLAGTKLPADVVRALLQGLADNSHISDLHLDLSSCELRSAGAQVIQDLIPDAGSISHLDLSDNGFDPDMVTLVLSIGRSKSIRHVSLGKNFNIKSKEGLLDVLHRIVQLTQEEDCPLQSLSVAESRLKLGTNVLLSALGSNTSLVSLDISGNAMGDTGAKMLAKALQINTKLRTVVWDRNNTTAHGLLEVAQALERNYTLKSMPLPMSDVAQAYRSHPERTEEAVHKLQSCLTRNQLRQTLPAQTFRLQQGILTTSSEQMVNEICLSVQKHVDILSTCTGREVEKDILCAEEAIRNANLSVSILPLLYEAGNTPYQNGKLQHKLECLTEEASQTCSREIQAIMQAVLDTAHGLCPAVVQKSGVRDQLVNAMSERVCLQDHLSLSAVLDQMVTDVFSKLNEIKLSVTAAVADCIVDAVLGDLTIAQCKLAESLSKQGLDLLVPLPESAEDDATALARGRNPPDLAAEEYKMALRRRNKHFRSIRPTPTVRTSSPARKPPAAAAGSIAGCAAEPPRTLPAGTAALPPRGGAAAPLAAPPRVGEGDGVRDDGDDDDDDDDGEARRGRVSTGTLSPLVGVSELEPAAGRDASGLRAHRAPPSLSPAAPPARPASTKDAEPASGSLPATQPAIATGFLMDLPTAGEKLEHCTKARPRPNRRHKQPPSKPNVQPVACENSEDRSITRVDEGLEDFFAKRLITETLPPTSPETCLGSAPLAPSGSRTLKKKIGNFFAFKKPKSSRGSRCEKEPEGGPTAPRSRRSMLSDILRAPSKAGESGKPLSKSEEGGLSAEPQAEPEHCQTPDSARRIRPKYSREGKSQSLILLSGEDEDALGVRHDKKRHLEKSEGELSSSFEQRVQVMLHRIGVTKGPAAESKKQQSKDSEIKKAGSDGDIVDSSADSPPSLKARTHSVSTDAPFRSPAARTEPSAEPRPAWKALGRQLPAEPPATSSDQPRRSFTLAEPGGLPEPGGREGWSSSLPRLGRNVPVALPRRVSHGGEVGAGTLPTLPTPPNTEDNRLMARLAAPRGTSRRALSVHEEQLREPECPAELGMGTVPLRLRRSPVLRHRTKHESLSEMEGEPGPTSDAEGATLQDWPRAGLEEPQAGAGTEGEQPQALAQTVGNAQDSAAVDQRRPVPGREEPALGQ
ncbi:capping protein, Arp2/3 and myosin-I linker protein 2 isoform X2 [Motacilla alba alba]|uniref:capping protein, Arp2/3 and myosin-I linker protein 2 isoform X2 n=1 Tax=Motacilla alba alba TaxID=1094192 RepID=UPI0018D592EF|nr:capping protein, Arp2/3 and myosin-I linker protein 2 isoform X2 [Motacilla alba alba]